MLLLVLFYSMFRSCPRRYACPLHSIVQERYALLGRKWLACHTNRTMTGTDPAASSWDLASQRHWTSELLTTIAAPYTSCILRSHYHLHIMCGGRLEGPGTFLSLGSAILAGDRQRPYHHVDLSRKGYGFMDPFSAATPF